MNLAALLHLEKKEGWCLFPGGPQMSPAFVSFLQQATPSLDTIRFLLSGILRAYAPKIFVIV